MYLAPTEDMQFLIDDVLDVGGVLGALPQYAELGLGPDLTTALLDEAAKFAAGRELGSFIQQRGGQVRP